jgi:heat-inducible transcriptional repressor
LLSPRTETILKSIINWYIDHAVPVSSQVLVHDYDLGVSSATVRNEMALLENEGYIVRTYSSAGCIPSDKGYRHYVASLQNCSLPISEQRMISHLFHQVEGRMDEWLSLAANVIARISQNMTVITVPRPSDCRFKHVEIVSIRDNLILLVLVLKGATLRQLLLNLDKPASQEELSALAVKLNPIFDGLTANQIQAQKIDLPDLEKNIVENVVKMLRNEDEDQYNKSYLEGLHFMINQPEFVHNQRILAVMELLEQRASLGTILPRNQQNEPVRVVIGHENQAEVAQDCSLVMSHYGLPAEASGIILVVGPTRMSYPRVISSVSYLSILLSRLVAELYGENAFNNTGTQN